MNINDIEIIEHDVLIVGAGGAGLRAAIETSANGLSTGVLGKSLLGKAHTIMAEGGIAAALGNMDIRDNWKIHFRDTIRGGKFLNQWEMVELLAKQAPDRVLELEKWGAVFDRTSEGLISQRNFGGHRYPRLAHVGDRTGLEIIRTLQDKVIHEKNISFYDECTGLELLTENQCISGLLAYWRNSQDRKTFVLFKAKAIIMATGGCGRAWKITTNSWEYTGDGLAMAYKAGAKLKDMEFIQYHPTGMVWPNAVKGLLVTESVRGDGGVLLNSKGQRFMFDYIPECFAAETAETPEEADRWLSGDKHARRPPELLTRDVVARAIKTEILAGKGSPHGGVYLDISSKLSPANIRKKLPSMYHQFKELAQLDITREPMEVGPTAHYTMGGIMVDSKTQESTISGLFACGECAAGLHGANRLGGNSLADLLVFGRLAGAGAFEYIKKLHHFPAISNEQVLKITKAAISILNRETGSDPYQIHDKLQNVMNELVGLVRSEKDLNSALQQIEALKKETANVKAYGTSQYNDSWSRALYLDSLLICSEAIIRSAIMRKESRGGHYRMDYEEEKNEWLKINLVVHKGLHNMQIDKVQREEPHHILKKIAYSTLEDLENGDD